MGREQREKSLDEIALECERILHSEECEDLDYLFAKGGSSGGARPKILTQVDGEEWIIKFPSSEDSKDIGKQEHATTINGNGINPGMDDILAVAKNIGLNMSKAKATASDIKDCVDEMLYMYI